MKRNAFQINVPRPQWAAFAALALVASLWWCPSASAALYLQEGFNYTYSPSGNPLAGNGAWVNSTPLVTVGNTNLIYATLADISPAGNDASVASNTSTTTDAYSACGFTKVTSGVVYASLLLDCSALQYGQNYTIIGLLPAAGNGGTFSSANDPCDIAMKTAADGVGYYMGARAYGQSATFDTTTELTNNTASFIVIKYNFSSKTASLFVSPDPTLGEPATPTVSSVGSSVAGDMSQIYLRAVRNALGVVAAPFQVDTLRVGSTWADVTPAVQIAPASKLVFATVPGTGTAGLPLGMVSVQIQNDSNLNISSNNVPITITVNGGSFSVGTTTVNTGAHGSASFTDLVIGSSGNFTLTVSASGIGAGLAPATSGTLAIDHTNTISPQGIALSAFLDSLEVETYWADGYSVNWLTGATNGSGFNMTSMAASHCSSFAAAVADLLGVYILRQPDVSDGGLANNQADWLLSNTTAGWTAVPWSTNAQHLANAGNLVVASYKDPNQSGHIAVLRPSTRADTDVVQYGPQECQSGVNNYNSTNVMTGFNQHPNAFQTNGIRYYAHTLTGPITPVNPALSSSSFSNGVFSVNATNIVGRGYNLQYTGDFAGWTNVVTYTNSNANSNFWCITTLTNVPAAGQDRRFYRLRAQ
jgi:hypothetical protein